MDFGVDAEGGEFFEAWLELSKYMAKEGIWKWSNRYCSLHILEYLK